jgi:hypothetical protein
MQATNLNLANLTYPNQRLTKRGDFSNLTYKGNQNVSFKGFSLPGVLSILENNPILSLATIDVIGMITPRTLIELNRNRKELGHPNWDAGREMLINQAMSSVLMYLGPGAIFNFLGQKLLDGKLNPLKVNTKSFTDYKTLDVIESNLQKVLNAVKAGGAAEVSVNEVNQKLIREVLGSVRSASTTATNPTKLSQEIIEQFIKEAEKVNAADPKAIQKFVSDFLPKATSHLKDTEVTLAVNESKSITTSMSNILRDMFTGTNDLVKKAANGAEKAPVESLMSKTGDLIKSLKKLKLVKTLLPFGIVLSLLLLLPKVNVWLTKKITGKSEFPGLAGVNGPEEKKPANHCVVLFLARLNQ